MCRTSLRYATALAAILLAATVLRAADPVAVALAPTPAPQTPAAAARRILILPFARLTAAKDKAWIATAVQQNLMTDLGRVPGLTAVPYALDVTIPSVNVAARLADQSGAQFAVMGAMQAVDLQVRLTAQVVDVKTADILGTAKVTGLESDLLKLEDQLSDEVRKIIRGENAVAQAAASISTATPAAAPVIVIIQAPAAPPAPAPAYYPNYGYPYSYPYILSGSYPYGYSGLGLPYLVASYPGAIGYNGFGATIGFGGFGGLGRYGGYASGRIGPAYPMTVTHTTYPSASLGVGSVLPTGNMISVYGATPSPFVASPGVSVTSH